MDTQTTWPALFDALLAGESLTGDQAAWAMNEIMSGAASPARVAALAVALRAKGETVAEVAGLAETMLAHATPISVPGDLVDIVGTGGDRAHTVNISTMGAIVAAAAGARVVKHGNRAASSACGSADLLEELGVRIDLPPERTAEIAAELGIGFCFAALFHPAYRYTAGARRELGVPTVFNFLGPLTNPARPGATAVGVSDRRMCGVLAGVLAERGNTALVFRGDDGLDELTTTGTSSVWVVTDQTVTTASFDPAELDLPIVTVAALRGGDAEYNAAVAHQVLNGAAGPVRDAVLLNAATALVAAAGGLDADRLTAALRSGYLRAARAVDSGAAAGLLARWVAATND